MVPLTGGVCVSNYTSPTVTKLNMINKIGLSDCLVRWLARIRAIAAPDVSRELKILLIALSILPNNRADAEDR